MAQRLVQFLLLITLRALQLTTLSRSNSMKANFKKPGKNGMNIFRGVMITGPPGIGKTTSAHLCAKLAGFTPIELNASDARSKKLVEVRRPWFFRDTQSNYNTEQHKHSQYIPGRVDGWGRGRGLRITGLDPLL
jgi:DNA polymerase III delta prime subunit